MTRRTPILLIGAGGHAHVCIDVIEEEGRFAIAGLLGLPHEIGNTVLGYPVIGTDLELASFVRSSPCSLIAIGQIKSPEPRMRIFQLLEQNGSQLATIVSPRAYVSRRAVLGAGTIVMPGAVVNAGAIIGRNCIINSQSLIEHDALIADHCHIATAAVINGGVQIGSGTFIGSGACVRQNVKIGERCLIGMGQQVFLDCASGITMTSQKTNL